MSTVNSLPYLSMPNTTPATNLNRNAASGLAGLSSAFGWSPFALQQLAQAFGTGLPGASGAAPNALAPPALPPVDPQAYQNGNPGMTPDTPSLKNTQSSRDVERPAAPAPPPSLAPSLPATLPVPPTPNVTRTVDKAAPPPVTAPAPRAPLPQRNPGMFNRKMMGLGGMRPNLY